MVAAKWVRRRACKSCEAQLTAREYAYSDGCCPYCGALSDGTFVDCHQWSERVNLVRPSLRARIRKLARRISNALIPE